MKYHFEDYKIRVNGESGHEAQTVNGVIVGPFGVARKTTTVHYEDGTAGQYHKVTHIHSGLCIVQLAPQSLDDGIAACRELEEAAPWWRSHNAKRIEDENGFKPGELKGVVIEIARKHNCIEFE